MAAEDFFTRWSKGKPAPEGGPEALPGAALKQEPCPAAKEPAPPPTLADVDMLRPDSDYAAFMTSGVDEAVRRSAMKKLFSDPHFNVMDGLDIYIEDYNRFEPIPAAMLGALHHAKALLDPLSQLEQPAPAPLAPDSGRIDAGEGRAETAAESPREIAPPATAVFPSEEKSLAPDLPSSAPDAEQNAAQKAQKNTHAPNRSGASDSNFSRP